MTYCYHDFKRTAFTAWARPTFTPSPFRRNPKFTPRIPLPPSAKPLIVHLPARPRFFIAPLPQLRYVASISPRYMTFYADGVSAFDINKGVVTV